MTRDQSPTPTVAAIGELHFEGNVVPHTFYSRPEFKSEKGVTQHVAILIYADDLYWYRPTYHRNEMTGIVERVTRKFSADKLQRTYDYYAQLFGVSKEIATAAVKFLVDRGLITREFRTIRLPDGRKASNVMFVEPVVDAVKVLMQLEAPGSPRWYWVAEPPKPNVKKEKGSEGGIRNKSNTYPEYSGYLSEADRRRIRNKPETNTKSSSETSPESGGVYNVTGDARATGDQAPVAEPSSAASTTPDASLQTHPRGLSGDDSGVEAQGPAGTAAHAAQGRRTASVLVLDGPKGSQFEQVPSIEKVPAGSGLDLDVAPHDPQHTRVVLERALGGPKRLTALMGETPPGLREGDRSAWLSQITPERSAELVTQGRAQQTMHPWTAITQLLDREIGARIKHGNAFQVEANNGHAYLTADEKTALRAGLPPVTTGEQWASRQTGKLYLIEEVTSQSVFVQDAGEYPLRKFHSLFEPAEARA